MPQEMIFVSRSAGLAKKNNAPYDMVTFLLGFTNITLTNKAPAEQYADLKEGDKVSVTSQIGVRFGNPDVTITGIKKVK